MEQEILTRKELYDLVWSTPLLTLSKKYSISDVGLRKICIKMNIPLPRVGYWQNVRCGKKTSIKPLPSKSDGDDKIELRLRGSENNSANQNLSLFHRLIKEIENDLSLPLKVPTKLTNPHRLILSARNYLHKNPQRDYRYDGLISTERGELDIKVTPRNVRRALRFMNALIKLLHARNHKIMIE